MSLRNSLGQLSLIGVGFLLILGSMWLWLRSVPQLVAYASGVIGAVLASGGFYWIHIEGRDAVWSIRKRLRVALGVVIGFPGALAVFFGLRGLVVSEAKVSMAALTLTGLVVISVAYFVGGKEAGDLLIYYLG